jgi:hypothetical protein
MATFFSAAVMAAGMSFTAAPAQAAFELPEGQKITNVPAIPRAIPQKEAYELYDPKIGKNFDLKNFWIRADVRVRPEMRTAGCFGNTFNVANNGSCNTPTTTGTKGKSNDSFVQQWVRLGIGYDLSPDVNFYMEIIDSAVWGANGAAGASNGAAGVDALNHNGSTGLGGGNNGRLGVRAAYMLIRNFAGVQGLSLKAGRQYVIFGNHSLFGHFDWANTGFSHDGVMLQYSTKSIDSYLGWFKTGETDLGQAAPVGSLGNGINANANAGDGTADADMIIFYNQIKSVPGFLIEPYYVFYKNATNSANSIAAFGQGAPKHGNQTRHTVGNRIEMRKGNWDAINETVYQFGSMGDQGAGNALAGGAGGCGGNGRCLSINAWATRNWIGYTMYESAWKPRLAFNFDYASGDGRNNCGAGAGGACKTANTFENFFPTNHIHMGYMDVQAWKNMMSPSVNFQARPGKDDHIEFWYTNLNLASARDNWYRGAQGAYIFSQAGNTKKHIGDELDFSWTHMMMDGKLAFQATYGYMFAGDYIHQNLGGSSTNQQWGYVQLWMNF